MILNCGNQDDVKIPSSGYGNQSYRRRQHKRTCHRTNNEFLSWHILWVGSPGPTRTRWSFRSSPGHLQAWRCVQMPCRIAWEFVLVRARTRWSFWSSPGHLLAWRCVQMPCRTAWEFVPPVSSERPSDSVRPGWRVMTTTSFLGMTRHDYDVIPFWRTRTESVSRRSTCQTAYSVTNAPTMKRKIIIFLLTYGGWHEIGSYFHTITS